MTQNRIWSRILLHGWRAQRALGARSCLVSATLLAVAAGSLGETFAAEATPPARGWHAFASNGGATSAQSRLYLFAGSGADSDLLGDLWFYRVGAGWTEIVPPAPTGRKGKSPPTPGARAHVGWSCGGGECVATGGTNGTSTLNETWVFTESTAAWSKVNCNRSPCPPARWGATMVWDPVRRQHLLFGGERSNNGLEDTYSFREGAWVQLDAFAHPSARRSAAAAFVPVIGGLGQVVLFGGQEVNRRALCDMWTWTGLGWEQIAATTQGPCLHSHSMAWETEAGGRLVVTGGYVDTDDTPNTQTWYFSFNASRTGGTWTRGSLACTGGTIRPGGRMALDVPSGEKVFFGGEQNLGGSVVRYDDTAVCASGVAGAASTASSPALPVTRSLGRPVESHRDELQRWTEILAPSCQDSQASRLARDAPERSFQVGSQATFDSMSIKKLRPLSEHLWSEGEAISSTGHAVGRSTSANGCEQSAVVWIANKGPKAVQPLPGDQRSRVRAANDLGVMVGGSHPSQVCREEGDSTPECAWKPVVWSSPDAPRLLDMPDFGQYAQARDVNLLGEVAGVSYSRYGCYGTGVFWSVDGKPKKLAAMPDRGYPDGYAVAVRSVRRGRLAAGFVFSSWPQRQLAVVWNKSGRPVARNPLPGHTDSVALDMNRDGLTVGSSWSSDSGPDAVMWTRRGKVQQLFPPDGGSESCEARAVNDDGVVAGTCWTYNDCGCPIEQAVVWESDGTAHVLPTADWVVEWDGEEWPAEACFATDISQAGTAIGGCYVAYFSLGATWK